MKSNVLRPLVVGITCALASGNVLADKWADQVVSAPGVTAPSYALGAPDSNYAIMENGETITLNFLDNICLQQPLPIKGAGAVTDVGDYINGFPDAPFMGWSNQVTFEAQVDGTELNAVYCDGGEILSWADFSGVIGDRKVKGNKDNDMTQNVSFKGVAYSAELNYGPDGGEGVAQVGWLEVNYRNGVSCNFFPDYPGNQIYLSDGDQRMAGLSWDYECSNEDSGSAAILLLNSALTSFYLGGGESIDGVPANGTYYLPGAKGKGRTKFRGAICIMADDTAYSVDGGSNVVFDDGEVTVPVCDIEGDLGELEENSGDLQWGDIKIGGDDYFPLF